MSVGTAGTPSNPHEGQFLLSKEGIPDSWCQRLWDLYERLHPFIGSFADLILITDDSVRIPTRLRYLFGDSWDHQSELHLGSEKMCQRIFFITSKFVFRIKRVSRVSQTLRSNSDHLSVWPTNIWNKKLNLCESQILWETHTYATLRIRQEGERNDY